MFGLLWMALLLCPLFGQERNEPDGFFSGTISEVSAEKLTVSRTILGKSPEIRSFILNPETKVEGRMKNKVRVTVRYAPGEQGDVALSVLVRDKPEKKK